jgi:predicted nucleic acid-binding protein
MRLYLDSCVLIYALDGAEHVRRHTLQQLELYANADWVISDLERMECLVGPLRAGDQIGQLAFRSFFADCTVVPLHPEVMERAAVLRASTRLQTADAIHLAAAVHWGCDALMTNDRAFQLFQAPIEVLRLEPDQSLNPQTLHHPPTHPTSPNSSSNCRWAAAGTKRCAAMAPLTATGGTPMPGKTPAPQRTRPSMGVPPPGKAPRLAGQAGP